MATHTQIDWTTADDKAMDYVKEGWFGLRDSIERLKQHNISFTRRNSDVSERNSLLVGERRRSLVGGILVYRGHKQPAPQALALAANPNPNCC
jgi:hypothetical protein